MLVELGEGGSVETPVADRLLLPRVHHHPLERIEPAGHGLQSVHHFAQDAGGFAALLLGSRRAAGGGTGLAESLTTGGGLKCC